jgi:hypothetical protein
LLIRLGSRTALLVAFRQPIDRECTVSAQLDFLNPPPDPAPKTLPEQRRLSRSQKKREIQDAHARRWIDALKADRARGRQAEMSDRGEYRSFFVSILDDLDFQAMDGLVFKLLFALKMSLGPAGIGILRKLDLVEKLGCSLDELESSLVVLEAPKPGETHGWILRERNIVWLINGCVTSWASAAIQLTTGR